MYRQSNYIGDTAAASTIAQERWESQLISIPNAHCPLPRDTYCARSPQSEDILLHHHSIFYQILAPGNPVRYLRKS
jgi:hypothetical protein